MSGHCRFGSPHTRESAMTTANVITGNRTSTTQPRALFSSICSSCTPLSPPFQTYIHTYIEVHTYIVFRMCYSCQYHRRKHTRSRKSRASNPTTFRLYRPLIYMYVYIRIYDISSLDTNTDYLHSLSNLVTACSIFLTDTVSELS